jgi:hypothetical protein
LGLAGAGLDRVHAAEGGEGRLGRQALRIVASGDEQRGSRVGSDAFDLQELRCNGLDLPATWTGPNERTHTIMAAYPAAVVGNCRTSTSTPTVLKTAATWASLWVSTPSTTAETAALASASAAAVAGLGAGGIGTAGDLLILVDDG